MVIMVDAIELGVVAGPGKRGEWARVRELLVYIADSARVGPEIYV